MDKNKKGILEEVKYYLKTRWSVGYYPDNLNSIYHIYSPDGSVFESYKLNHYLCPFCDEDDPNWEESRCDHSEELLNLEKNARNLFNLILLVPGLQERNLP